MKIAMGNDHAGFTMRTNVQEILRDLGCVVVDFGTPSPNPVDFPDIAMQVCGAVISQSCERGIMVCEANW